MKVIVHTREDCPSCVRVKEFLAGINVAFTPVVHATQAERDALYDSFGLTDAARRVPQVVLHHADGTVERIGGYEKTLVSRIGSRYRDAVKALQTAP